MSNAPRVGDRESLYAHAADAYGAALERLARAYEPDPDKRRDLLQEIHVALWRSLARFDGRCSLRTWVYRVAHNTATSKALRPRTNAPKLVALDDTLESIAAANSEEQTLDRRRALDRLHELIRQLRPLDRHVMLLYLEQLDAASIAEITGLSAANVATKVRRIKTASDSTLSFREESWTSTLTLRFGDSGRNRRERSELCRLTTSVRRRNAWTSEAVSGGPLPHCCSSCS